MTSDDGFVVPSAGSSEASRSGAGPDEHVSAAVSRTHLGSLPAGSLQRLVADSTDITLPAGAQLHPEGGAPFAVVVVSGLVRVVATSPDGREVTIRYTRPGEMLGISSLFSSRRSLVTAAAVHDARLLMLRVGAVREMALRDTAVAGVLLAELADRVMEYQAELMGSNFAGVRQKLARHLLDMAVPMPAPRRLVAPVTQAQLADAAGTTREVVVRILRDLRAEGLVDTGREEIVLLAPERLHEESWPGTS